MRQRFRDKIVIVTGASSGIGRDTAIRFAEEGARLVLTARSRAGLDETAARIQPGRSLVVPADVTRRQDVDFVAAGAVEQFGRIDILVNNAGIGYFGAAVATPETELRHVFEVNFFGLVACTQSVLPFMMQQGRGQIINISSVVGRRAFDRMAAYSASKFAVTGYSEALRLEVARYGIDVILVCPTTTDTPFFDLAGSDGHTPKKTKSPVVMTTTQVARAIVAAAAGRKREVVLSRTARVFLKANCLMPGLTDWVLRRMAGRE